MHFAKWKKPGPKVIYSIIYSHKIIEKKEFWGQKTNQRVSQIGEWGETDYKGYTGIFKVDIFCVVADNGS